MGFLSNLFSSEPDLESFTIDQMVRYTNSLTAWLDAHPTGFNTPEHIKEKRKHKQALLDKAITVWQRKIGEHAEQHSLSDPFGRDTPDILAEAVDNSINSLQDYIEYAVLETGLSNEEVQKYSIELLNQFEKEYLSQGLTEKDAPASAFSRLISERPLPNIESHQKREINNAIQYKIKAGIGLTECPIGSSYTVFQDIFGGEPFKHPNLGDSFIFIQSKENGVLAFLEEDKITQINFTFSNETYNDFSGKTEKDIGKNSTIDDVINKYFEPDIEDECDDEDDLSINEPQIPISKKSLNYSHLGIRFNFENGQLKEIIASSSNP